MRLTTEERAMLAGKRGAPVQRAIEQQIQVGEFWGAKRFVEVTSVHMMGDIEVMGEAGLDFLRSTCAARAQCVRPTSTNARCIDFAWSERFGQSPGTVARERELISCLRRMNVTTVDTCINYQTVYQPHLGEHVAWGDTGTVIYANSVFGARSNFEAGPAALAAALTGRTPEYGFHLDPVRRGNVLVEVDARPGDLADWGALGRIVGTANQDYFAVPVFAGDLPSPSSDALKHLGASLASYGSLAMFHMPGVTPEAASVREALAGKRPKARMRVSARDLERIYRGHRIAEGGTVVVFSGPQLSIWELQSLAALFGGQQVHPSIRCFATTSQQVLAEARKLGVAQALEQAGVQMLEGVCFYTLERLSDIRRENGWANLVSNSAKLVNTITAHRFNTILRRTADCVRIAVTGEVS